MLEILAQSAAPTTQSASSNSMIMFAPIIIIVLLYFFMFSTKKKQDKKRQEMIDQIKKGDRVQTIGGILGTVVSVDGTEVLLKVDESSNAKIKFTRAAIHHVIDEAKSDAK